MWGSGVLQKYISRRNNIQGAVSSCPPLWGWALDGADPAPYLHDDPILQSLFDLLECPLALILEVLHPLGVILEWDYLHLLPLIWGRPWDLGGREGIWMVFLSLACRWGDWCHQLILLSLAADMFQESWCLSFIGCVWRVVIKLWVINLVNSPEVTKSELSLIECNFVQVSAWTYSVYDFPNTQRAQSCWACKNWCLLLRYWGGHEARQSRWEWLIVWCGGVWCYLFCCANSIIRSFGDARRCPCSQVFLLIIWIGPWEGQCKNNGLGSIRLARGSLRWLAWFTQNSRKTILSSLFVSCADIWNSISLEYTWWNSKKV